MPNRSQSDRIKRAAAAAGFDLAGIAAVSGGPWRELEVFRQWIEAGHAGEMEYLKSRDEQGRLKRAAIAHVAPWARSVVVCAINYNAAAPYSTECTNPERGWISRYAWGGSERPADYHDTVLLRLLRVEAELQQMVREAGQTSPQTCCYVDTGPVVERVLARHAGVGWIGKNTCVIHPRLGSWLFLGVILCSLELEPDLPAPDRCGTCTRCLDACPTNALPAPYQLDATRCISYLTIEKRGSIPEELRESMGRHIFGCDICQDVCPWNRRAPASAEPEFQPRPELVNPALEWLAGMREEEFRKVFRHSALRRTRFSGVRRNVAVALGNSGWERFRPLLEKMEQDADPVVAEHARWALARLPGAGQSSAEVGAAPQAQPEAITS